MPAFLESVNYTTYCGVWVMMCNRVCIGAISRGCSLACIKCSFPEFLDIAPVWGIMWGEVVKNGCCDLV